MGFIPTITCRKCRRPYSGIYKKCPHCGARRQAESSRTAATTDSVQKGTAASARAATNNVWQMAFALILLTVVMLSVIVLITTSLNDRAEADDPNNPNNIVATPPEISPAVTDPVVTTPVPTTAVQPTSLGVFYNTSPMDAGFTHIIDGAPLTLTATVYPIDQQFKIDWRSTDTQVFTVETTDNGATAVITGKGVGSAKLIVSCGEIQKEIPVIIKQSW